MLGGCARGGGVFERLGVRDRGVLGDVFEARRAGNDLRSRPASFPRALRVRARPHSEKRGAAGARGDALPREPGEDDLGLGEFAAACPKRQVRDVRFVFSGTLGRFE